MIRTISQVKQVIAIFVLDFFPRIKLNWKYMSTWYYISILVSRDKNVYIQEFSEFIAEFLSVPSDPAFIRWPWRKECNRAALFFVSRREVV
jgi:hypothetical protein